MKDELLSELRTRLMDTDRAIWQDNELQHAYDVRKTIHGVIATCMKQLAMSPATARRWERHGVKYTHYDYESMAKYHSGLAKHELEKGKG